MDITNPTDAKHALELLCHFYGVEPTSEEVWSLYVSLAASVEAVNRSGAKLTVEDVVQRVLLDILRQIDREWDYETLLEGAP